MMRQRQEAITKTQSAEAHKLTPYNMAKDIEQSIQRKEDAFWERQWDRLLYPDDWS